MVLICVKYLTIYSFSGTWNIIFNGRKINFLNSRMFINIATFCWINIWTVTQIARIQDKLEKLNFFFNLKNVSLIIMRCDEHVIWISCPIIFPSLLEIHCCYLGSLQKFYSVQNVWPFLADSNCLLWQMFIYFPCLIRITKKICSWSIFYQTHDGPGLHLMRLTNRQPLNWMTRP